MPEGNRLLAFTIHTSQRWRPIRPKRITRMTPPVLFASTGCDYGWRHKYMYLSRNKSMQKMFIKLTVLGLLLVARVASAGTFATFETTVGSMELEFYDEDKPVTVSNFVAYVTSGRWENQFLQRWETNFV